MGFTANHGVNIRHLREDVLIDSLHSICQMPSQNFNIKLHDTNINTAYHIREES